MFGRALGHYLKAKEDAAKLSEVEVTEEEFIAAMMESGQNRDEAETKAKVSKGLGASIRVGDRMLSIKDKP
jgi:hypothetical protein